MASPVINDVIQAKLHEFAKEVVRRAKLNLGATRTIKYNDGTSKRRRMVATGNLQNSISYIVTAGGVHSAIQFFMASYGKYLDAGVSGLKHKVRGGSPYKYGKLQASSISHKEAMFKWIKARNIKARDPETGSFIKTTDAKRRNMAYFMARKIKERGLPKTEFFSEGFEELYAELPAQLQFLIAEEVGKFLDELNIQT